MGADAKGRPGLHHVSPVGHLPLPACQRAFSGAAALPTTSLEPTAFSGDAVGIDPARRRPVPSRRSRDAAHCIGSAGWAGSSHPPLDCSPRSRGGAPAERRLVLFGDRPGRHPCRDLPAAFPGVCLPGSVRHEEEQELECACGECHIDSVWVTTKLCPDLPAMSILEMLAQDHVAERRRPWSEGVRGDERWRAVDSRSWRTSPREH